MEFFNHSRCSCKCLICSVVLAFTLTFSAITTTLRSFSETALKQCCPCGGGNSSSILTPVKNDLSTKKK
ncbi:MAG: hypothetical protein FWF76_00430 [Oscillospiraceae bacterium]|nr:hypothetical protein [Oscillospiraceae bacterium]